MLSSVQRTRTAPGLRQILPWSPVRALRNVADVQETDNHDREEYLFRLGLVLQVTRKRAGLTQEQAGDQLGMSAATLGRWEAGQNAISGYDLIRLVRLYDFDADLIVNPPKSKPAIRRRLGVLADRAQDAARRGLLRPLEDDGEPE
jgi:transcriptional regulator with XRE-family HTH domain